MTHTFDCQMCNKPAKKNLPSAEIRFHPVFGYACLECVGEIGEMYGSGAEMLQMLDEAADTYLAEAGC